MTEHDLIMLLMPALGAITSAVGLGIYQILGKIFGSLQQLNVKIAVVIERQNNHETRIEKLEQN